MPAHAPERALARIDLGALRRNCQRLRERLRAGTELCAVVKADAYGHGLHRCARAARAGGASWLAVATAGEAAELRRHAVDGPLLVMGALTPAALRTALEARADVVAWTPELLAAAAAHAEPPLPPARVHVKLDTGMGRLGTRSAAEATALARAAERDERLELVGVMSHFATADARGDAHFPAQLERFADWVGELGDLRAGVLAHVANSAATLRDDASHFDMVRCGVATYGLDPFGADPAAHGLDPALALESVVAAVRRFEAGAGAGYGQTWVAPRETWVATLPIGYGDGWRRGLSNNADVLIRGRRHPLVGTVSMDNITVDLGPETDVQVGDTAVLIGAQGAERILCEEVARRLGTINYEVTTGLLARTRRAHSE